MTHSWDHVDTSVEDDFIILAREAGPTTADLHWLVYQHLPMNELIVGCNDCFKLEAEAIGFSSEDHLYRYLEFLQRCLTSWLILQRS